MKINREQLLKDLEMVKAGTSPREFIEQSSCFVFMDGEVRTFNEEVACRKKVELNVTGAVQAKTLLEILDKLPDDELTVTENGNNELEFIGKKRRFGVIKDAEIFLPVDRVEDPGEWHRLSPEFIEAVTLVQHCVSRDENRFLLTCIHIHPKWIEACDNVQAMRCRLATGVEESVLVRGPSLQHITSLGMNKISLTRSWVHFCNQDGLTFSCRRYSEEYPPLKAILQLEGHAIVIPKSLADAAERASVFAADKAGDPLVIVTLIPGKIRIRGEGLTGWFEEVKKAAYDGPPMEFTITPELLKQISQRYSEAQITDEKLKVSGGSWSYCTVLGANVPQESAESPKPAKKK